MFPYSDIFHASLLVGFILPGGVHPFVVSLLSSFQLFLSSGVYVVGSSFRCVLATLVFRFLCGLFAGAIKASVDVFFFLSVQLGVREELHHNCLLNVGVSHVVAHFNASSRCLANDVQAGLDSCVNLARHFLFRSVKAFLEAVPFPFNCGLFSSSLFSSSLGVRAELAEFLFSCVGAVLRLVQCCNYLGLSLEVSPVKVNGFQIHLFLVCWFVIFELAKSVHSNGVFVARSGDRNKSHVVVTDVSLDAVVVNAHPGTASPFNVASVSAAQRPCASAFNSIDSVSLGNCKRNVDSVALSFNLAAHAANLKLFNVVRSDSLVRVKQSQRLHLKRCKRLLSKHFFGQAQFIARRAISVPVSKNTYRSNRGASN